MDNIILTTKKVAEIEGEFVLPDYQRGYRWTKEEVKLLLDDIYENGSKPYCLQPIVVKTVGDKTYELIDGQQRLTTIYLIYKYLESKFPIYSPSFGISYETREKSGQFLQELDMSRRDENIDFFFMTQAFEFLTDYFEPEVDGKRMKPKPEKLTKLHEYFAEQVSVIWYEVDSEENGIELFERLNIGKIPLTSSELVKALFLRDNAKEETGNRQEEISLQWDIMENTLRESSFWGFLTNAGSNEYPTRIDLILDIIAGKTKDTKDKYFTFFHFDRRIKELTASGEQNALQLLWGEIYHVYLTLREWYLNHEFYHKIGYLVNSNYKTIGDIYKLWLGEDEIPLAKDIFTGELDRLIRESISLKDEIALNELSYTGDQTKLHNVLLLFNVETERNMDEHKRRFPFDKHKENNWSLEHIHAQHSEGLETNEKIHTWLKDHVKLLHSGVFGNHAELANRMDAFITELESTKNVNKARQRFQDIQQETNIIFSSREAIGKEQEYRDNIANMALIDTGKNAALSNYVFDAKRDIIIDYDKKGAYLPICTKMVFFKYYSPADTSLHFWGESDRKQYMENINRIIQPFYSPSLKDNEND